MKDPRLFGNFRPAIEVSKVQVQIRKDGSSIDMHLLVDGIATNCVYFGDGKVTSGDFGIYNNTPWYVIDFPGEGREVENDVPDRVFEILDGVVAMILRIIGGEIDLTFDITDALKETGCKLYLSMRKRKDQEGSARIFKRLHDKAN